MLLLLVVVVVGADAVFVVVVVAVVVVVVSVGDRVDSAVLAAVHLHPQLALLAERKLNDAGRLGCILRVSLDKETS